ncbi:MAG: HAD family hydrolase [Armatimonadota bacterium]
MRNLQSYRSRALISLLATLIIVQLMAVSHAAGPLPSWTDNPAKESIIQFVKTVTDKSSPNYVPPEDRIAVFDNDGTLWTEQPIPFQFAFAIDRVKELAPQHPEWKNEQPFKAILENDRTYRAKATLQDVGKIIMATHAGMTTDEFQNTVSNWIATARHPRFQRPYTDLVYQPMLELLIYLRTNGFKTFIVSGGTSDFMRPWVENVYSIPPEQVVGSSLVTEYEMQNRKPFLKILPKVDFIDDKAGKPVGIHKFIGRRPVMAVGNSDGDLQMLQYTAGGSGIREMLLIHHTDANREYAYDKGTEEALKAARENGWTVIDMQRDWKVIYPFEIKKERGK